MGALVAEPITLSVVASVVKLAPCSPADVVVVSSFVSGAVVSLAAGVVPSSGAAVGEVVAAGTSVAEA